VQQGGVSVADAKITDIAAKYTLDSFAGDGLVVKRGKKKFVKVVAK
jgi:tyrosyl-tRNA synthetase